MCLARSQIVRDAGEADARAFDFIAGVEENEHRRHGLVIDVTDAALEPAIEAMGTKVRVVPTLMRSVDDRRVLGKVCVEFARALVEEKRLRSVP